MRQFIIAFLFLLGTVALLPSCRGGGEDKLGDEYSWLEGTWKTQNEDLFGVVVIEKNRFKFVSWVWNESPSDIKSVKWIPIDIKYRYIGPLEGTYLTLSDDYIIVDNDKKELNIVTGEYSYDVLTKEGGIPPEKEVVKDKKENNLSKEKSKSIKSSSSNRAWKHAFDYGKCALFDTGFINTSGYNEYHNGPSIVYIALFPYVYSEDGLEGKMFQFFLTDLGREHNDQLRTQFCGNYEVIGDYIRFFNYFDSRGNSIRKERIYQIVEDDSGICLQGRHRDDNTYVNMRQSSDNDAISFAEQVYQRADYYEFDVAIDL